MLVLRREDVLQCRRELYHVIQSLRTEIEAHSEVKVRPGTIGIKVWVLPPWYYTLTAGDHETIRCGVDFMAHVVRWPVLSQVGLLQGAEGSRSGTRWVVGKGLLGQAIFSADK